MPPCSLDGRIRRRTDRLIFFVVGSVMIARALVCLIFAFFLPIVGAFAQAKKPAEWTFMVFMNGDNNLEPFAIEDFEEMAKVGSTDDVNVIVQFDRIDGGSQAYGNWTGTLRFRVTKGMEPTYANAVMDLGEANMGDGATLRAFVEWARTEYPAKRYALVIWNHGQGWRMRMATAIPAVNDPEREALSAFVSMRRAADPLEDATLSQAFPGTVRSVSNDDSSSDVLYNREIEDALRPILSARKLDLIGFDACLMAMIETGYAMRELAQVMVASEELEPGPGWNYELLLGKLTASPAMDGRALGRTIVKAFEEHYGKNGIEPDDTTTLSAVDLSQLPQLAGLTSVLADRLVHYVKAHPGKMRSIRGAGRVAYGFRRPYRLEYSVDLDFLAEKLIARTGDPRVIQAAHDLRDAIRSVVLANFAGEAARSERGSRGIAIYFPPSNFYFQNVDPDHDAYRESNTNYPVEFVQHHRWDNFLISSYFVDTPGP